jgi:hypothetical protein
MIGIVTSAAKDATGMPVAMTAAPARAVNARRERMDFMLIVGSPPKDCVRLQRNQTAERRRTIFIDKKQLPEEASRGFLKLQVGQPGLFCFAHSSIRLCFIMNSKLFENSN